MGYNFFNEKEVPRAINTRLIDFFESFGETFNKRKNVSFADRDIKYLLGCTITKKGSPRVST